MKVSPGSASEMGENFQYNLLMSLNHQKCASAILVGKYHLEKPLFIVHEQITVIPRSLIGGELRAVGVTGTDLANG
jgi:hypothetical protein